MLNRRTLRVKAMQTAFAYRQCKEANYANALENIRQAFLPDLNSMEPQDPALLSQQGQEAHKLFEKYVFTDFKKITDSSTDKVNTITFQEIRDYHSNNQKDQKFLKNQMLLSAEALLNYYYLNLLLLSEFAAMATKDQRINQTNFGNNRVIAKITGNQQLRDFAIRKNASWKDEEGMIRQWFKDFIKTDEEYLNYNNKENVTFDDDKELVLHLIKKILFGNEVIESYWNDQDLQWSEDRAVVLSMVKKTVKDLEPEDDDFELQVLSYNWEDDRDFFKELLESSLTAAEKYKELISKRTSNWDIERLATTDRIILEMAIAEMTGFPSIPVKVTINEYIEVSKRYSTPKSKQFINGLLDAISKDLTNEGAIKKSGRGLIDNK